MNRTGEWRWHENDQPIDFSVFESMTKEERHAEITRLEAEARKGRNRIDNEMSETKSKQNKSKFFDAVGKIDIDGEAVEELRRVSVFEHL